MPLKTVLYKAAFRAWSVSRMSLLKTAGRWLEDPAAGKLLLLLKQGVFSPPALLAGVFCRS